MIWTWLERIIVRRLHRAGWVVVKEIELATVQTQFVRIERFAYACGFHAMRDVEKMATEGEQLAGRMDVEAIVRGDTGIVA